MGMCAYYRSDKAILKTDAGSLVRALEEIREICNGYGLEAGKACDIAFHALDAFRGEK